MNGTGPGPDITLILPAYSEARAPERVRSKGPVLYNEAHTCRVPDFENWPSTR